MRILAVDDDPVILDLLGTSLEKCGFGEVTFAANAEDALELIQRAPIPYDTFLLDIMLPGTSGIDMCREIRKFDVYRATPIIMITASRAPDMMTRAFGAGATDFVTKPFDGLELGTRINLAAMLNDSLQRERMNSHALEELSRLTAISFDERFDMRKGPGVMGFLSLENELLRKGDALYAMTLLSVQIDNALGIFRGTQPAQFRATVEAVGVALTQTIDVDSTRVAYAGRGAVVAVTYSRDRVDMAALDQTLNAALVQKWDAVATGMENAPSLSLLKIDEQRLWSGISAAGAMRSFQGRADLNESKDPHEVNGLFARLSMKIGSI